MDLSTKLFGDFCVACLVAVVLAVTVVTVGVIAWVSLSGG